MQEGWSTDREIPASKFLSFMRNTTIFSFLNNLNLDLELYKILLAEKNKKGEERG